MNKQDFNDYFDRMFETSNQNRFEAWFLELSACVWGADFEPIKAGGAHGDKKCDGRRVSTETVFQCYAPESNSTFAKDGPAKVAKSFEGIREYWPNLKEWVFIHNNAEGITAKVSDVIEALRVSHPDIKISTASRRYLKDELHDRLTLSQMYDLYPSARLDFKDVGMEHVRPLLKRIIQEKSTDFDPNDFGEIPNEAKLDYNSLSPDAKHNIKRARPNIGIVDRFIDRMSNPVHASTLQSKLRCKYKELSDYGYEPDEILGQLLAYVRGEEEPKATAAAYVILAYYFDACDIFENVPEEQPC